MTGKVEKIKTGIENAGVADATAAVVKEDSAWIKNKRYMYFASMILPGIPILSAFLAGETGNGLWLWSLLFAWYAILPVLDHFLGLDSANPSDELVEELGKDRYYVYIMYGATVAHWLAIIYVGYTIQRSIFLGLTF